VTLASLLVATLLDGTFLPLFGSRLLFVLFLLFSVDLRWWLFGAELPVK